MPGAYPSSLTTEHVKSHLQKLRVKCKESRAMLTEDCDQELLEEYDVASGALIALVESPETSYVEILSRFSIPIEMLTDPTRFDTKHIIKEQEKRRKNKKKIMKRMRTTAAGGGGGG